MKVTPKMAMGRVFHGPWASDPSYGPNGAFLVTGPAGTHLKIIASDGIDPACEGWEHVSVSCSQAKRCPNWIEMCWVKDQFWDEEDTVIQFHPPKSEYVNYHYGTLHLWRHRNPFNMIQTPPSILVGPK